MSKISHETYLLQQMLLIRRFEECICQVYDKQDMKSPVHLCIGEEAIYAGVCANLHKDDYATTTHRNHGVCLAKGIDPYRMFAECYGKADGCCKGFGGSPHCSSKEHGIYGTSAIVGGGVPLGVGLAFAAQMRGTQQVSAIFFGDGAFEEGTTIECLNYAALRSLSVLFVCTNNFYATVSPIQARQPDIDIWKRAQVYMPTQLVDGVDVRAVSTATSEALERIRAGKGPYFLECRAYRWKEHVGHLEDWKRGARPKKELEEWQARCPIEREKKRLCEKKITTQAHIDVLEKHIMHELTIALESAQDADWDNHSKNTLLTSTG